MVWTYAQAETRFARRRKGADDCPTYDVRTVRLEYDAKRDCYRFRHHRTVTVEVFRGDIYRIYTHGWDSVTTKSNIAHFGPVRLWSTKPTPSAQYGLYFCSGEKTFKHFDGMEVDQFGAPTNPADPRYRYQARRTVRRPPDKAFNRMLRQVWERIGPRLMVGEFEKKEEEVLPMGRVRWPNEAPHPGVLYGFLEDIVKVPDGEHVPSEMVEPLLIFRPLMQYGRVAYHQPYANRPAIDRLKASLAAVRRWHNDESREYRWVTIDPLTGQEIQDDKHV